MSLALARPRLLLDYEVIFNSARNAMAFTEKGSGIIVDINASWIESTGLTREQAIGKTAFQLGLWASMEEREACHAALVEKDEIQDIEVSLVMRSVVQTYLLSARNVDLDGKGFVLWEFVYISDRKRSEERVRQLHHDLDATLQAIPDVLFEFDDKGTYLNVWTQSPELLAAQRELLLGRTVADVLPAPAAETVMQTLQEALIKGYSRGRIIHIKVARGESWFELSASVKPSVDSETRRFIVLSRDVTERVLAEDKLRISEDRFRHMLETSPIAVRVARADGQQVIFANPKYAELINADIDSVIGRNPLDYYRHHRDYEDVLARLKNGERIFNRLVELNIPGYGIKWALASYLPIQFENETAVLGWFYDITERRELEQQQQMAAKVFTHANEGITITAPDGTILDVNDAFTTITGYSREEVIGRNSSLLSSGRQSRDFYVAMWQDLLTRGSWSGEIWNRRKNGEFFVEWITISAVRDNDGQPQQYVGLFSDITAQKQHQQQLAHIAYHDPLTQLPNRSLLADRMRQALASATRASESLSVVCLDLDGFKAINDSFGHEVGDRLLIEVANRLMRCVRAGDTVARLGGDEFVMLIGGIESHNDTLPTLSRVLRELMLPVDLGDGISVSISGSIGYTLFPEDNVDADTLIRHADNAMFSAKQSGKNRFQRFNLQQETRIKANWEALLQIEEALEKHEFRLFVQPKVELASGRVVGVEALIRWAHPTMGVVLPEEFIPLVENDDLALRLGNWVIEQGLDLLSSWAGLGLEMSLSVNVSARQLRESDFSLRLAERLRDHPGVAPQLLELEIVESAALDDMQKVSSLIAECQALGVRFSLDDFGTGYSSLTYLKRLSVDALKIDQSFIRDMLEDDSDLAIVHGVVGLARAFRSQTVAEGVETWEHAARLKLLGCEIAQGYAIAQPMPAENFTDWLATFRMPDI